jgi:hypothetical protein
MTAARLTAVVVLPTPPFWLATAIDLVIDIFGALNLTHYSLS